MEVVAFGAIAALIALAFGREESTTEDDEKDEIESLMDRLNEHTVEDWLVNKPNHNHLFVRRDLKLPDGRNYTATKTYHRNRD